MKIRHFIVAMLAACLYSCSGNVSDDNAGRAMSTLDALYEHYSAPDTELLRENYPFDEDYKAGYLASEEHADTPNPYSYLWPYSGTFSAVNALYDATGDAGYKELLDNRVLAGLEHYFDTVRKPDAYSSYIDTAPASDRFYDDNVWLGIDFTDLFLMTREDRYLGKAELIWSFIESGMDDTLGGGIYWCEQTRKSKNACSNAPGAVLALKLYEATGDTCYLDRGKFLYQWTKANLQDPEDKLYYDNIGINGRLDKRKFAYNSGQMIQAAALLYKITGKETYLKDAQESAASAHEYFFHDFTPQEGEGFRLLNKGNIWFTAVMMRGFVELYALDGNIAYLDDFDKSLDHAWDHARDVSGLFSADWSGESSQELKWLLTQAAFVEMYARMSSVDRSKP